MIDVVTRACQRRLTTAGRLAREQAQGRRTAPAVASDCCTICWTDVADGVLSPLERRWKRYVETRPRAAAAGAGTCAT